MSLLQEIEKKYKEDAENHRINNMNDTVRLILRGENQEFQVTEDSLVTSQLRYHFKVLQGYKDIDGVQEILDTFYLDEYEKEEPSFHAKYTKRQWSWSKLKFEDVEYEEFKPGKKKTYICIKRRKPSDHVMTREMVHNAKEVLEGRRAV